MEEIVRAIAHYVSLACDLATVLVLAYGAAMALYRMVLHIFRAQGSAWAIKVIWLRFASTILLALEFALAADIAETAVAPTLEDIGKLAAIATIRTALNYFLAKDLSDYAEVTEGNAKVAKADQA